MHGSRCYGRRHRLVARHLHIYVNGRVRIQSGYGEGPTPALPPKHRMYTLRLLGFLGPYKRRSAFLLLCVIASSAAIIAMPQLIRWAIDYGLDPQRENGAIRPDSPPILVSIDLLPSLPRFLRGEVSGATSGGKAAPPGPSTTETKRPRRRNRSTRSASADSSRVETAMDS